MAESLGGFIILDKGFRGIYSNAPQMLAPEKISLTYSSYCEENQVFHEVKLVKLILRSCTYYFPGVHQNTLLSRSFSKECCLCLTQSKVDNLRAVPPSPLYFFTSRLYLSVKWKSL